MVFAEEFCSQWPFVFFFYNFLKKFIYDRHTVREREAETQAEGEAGSMHREPDVGLSRIAPWAKGRC